MGDYFQASGAVARLKPLNELELLEAVCDEEFSASFYKYKFFPWPSLFCTQTQAANQLCMIFLSNYLSDP